MTEARCTCWRPTDPHQPDCQLRREEERRLAAMWRDDDDVLPSVIGPEAFDLPAEDCE